MRTMMYMVSVTVVLASMRLQALAFASTSRAIHVRGLRSLRMITHGLPPTVEKTGNFQEASALSERIRNLRQKRHEHETPKTVAVIGGGLSGLACAKYLVDAGMKPIVLEARDVLGGKVSAWKDKDGDWIETGLHIFFGAYPNMMNLFKELDIRDRLQLKDHRMTFAMQDLPGQYTSFQFIPGVPAPFNMALAILTNTEMLSWSEKILMVPALLPMLIYGQDFIDEQDELSVIEFMEQRGMPSRVNDEIFIAMSKALDFIDPEKLSMTVILTAMNRFINEADGSQTAFLDGNASDRLCGPLAEYILAHGGEIHMNCPVSEFSVATGDQSVRGLVLENGSRLEADEYVSAMPVDIFRRLLPEEWSSDPFFAQTHELEGIPVINIQIWLDGKLNSLDGLCFSRSPLLSVYADMSRCCKEYEDPDCSMLELVFAPCTPAACSDADAPTAQNWMGKPNEEIIDATMGELARLFPLEIAADERWPSVLRTLQKQRSFSDNEPNTKQFDNPSGLRVRKYTVVKTPRSVYAAFPGRNKYRPSQKTPIPNFTLAGDWSSQRFLGSMEGAVLAGKLAAEVVAEKYGQDTANYPRLLKPIHDSILERQPFQPKKPVGLMPGPDNAIRFGGGADVGSSF